MAAVAPPPISTAAVASVVMTDTTAAVPAPLPPATREDAGTPVLAVAESEPLPGAGDDEVPSAWLDEQAESAFRAEARDRGESPPAARPPEDATEDSEPGALPKLDELVARIPAEVRETLEDLFRARFVAVRRVPKKALKA